MPACLPACLSVDTVARIRNCMHAWGFQRYGKTPFYLAMKWTGVRNESTSLWTRMVTKMILHVCPSAVRAVDPAGRTVLHAAVKYDAPIEVVQRLLQEW